jgi:hypothetical protein
VGAPRRRRSAHDPLSGNVAVVDGVVLVAKRDEPFPINDYGPPIAAV